MIFRVLTGLVPRALCGLALTIACAMLGTVGCSKESHPKKPSNQALQVFVSIPPQAYFVQRIGRERVGVEVLLSPGMGPDNYDPSAKQLARLSRSDAFFRIGVPFENKLMPKITSIMPQLKIIDTRQGITLRKMQGTHDDDHTHGCDHAGRDPHIWLSPQLVKQQARTICKALNKLDPKHAAYYDSNLREFLTDLDKLDAKIAKTLAPMKGQTFFVFHPAFGYFADAYGLTQQAVEIEGKKPSAKQLGKLIDQARAKGARVIFVEPQFPRQSAHRIAKAIDGVVVPIDPLAEDYMKNLATIAEKIGNSQ
ncbi:MAG TPA: ABC transporter substrate-binding protein [Phycisphaerae bacterium]|nr:ABC transporter substrate-binding protein [Phycisphaerae bacterium]